MRALCASIAKNIKLIHCGVGSIMAMISRLHPIRHPKLTLVFMMLDAFQHQDSIEYTRHIV